MIDDAIQKLIDRDSTIDLRELEAAVWQRDAHVRAIRGANRKLASWQGFVLVFAILSSATAGATMAMNAPYARSNIAALPGETLAPSSLLFGRQR
jgi:hypothetical protein